MKKRILALSLVCTLVVGSIAIANAGGVDFKDLKESHWAYKNVTKMAEQGIVKGYPDGTFKPNATVTYAEFIKMMVVAVTGEDPGSKGTGHWAKSYYDLAAETDMLKVVDIPASYLDKSIPRADMAYLVANSVDGTVSDSDAQVLAKAITDYSKAGNRKGHVLTAYGFGIITGYPNGTFGPEKTLNRAESAAVVARIMDKSQRIMPDIEALKEKQGSVVDIKPGQDIIDILRNPSSQKPIDEIAKGMNQFPVAQNVKYYQMVSGDAFEFKLATNLLGGQNIDCNYKLTAGTFGVLIKDGKAVYQLSNAGGESLGVSSFYVTNREDPSLKLPDFDYIGFSNRLYDTMVITPNPFK